jgi:hypothetical protein
VGAAGCPAPQLPAQDGAPGAPLLRTAHRPHPCPPPTPSSPAGAIGAQYKAKFRSLLFNLKDPINPELRARVLTGEVPPARLARMEPHELASRDLAQWRSKREQQHDKELVLDAEAAAKFSTAAAAAVRDEQLRHRQGSPQPAAAAAAAAAAAGAGAAAGGAEAEAGGEPAAHQVGPGLWVRPCCPEPSPPHPPTPQDACPAPLGPVEPPAPSLRP